MLIWQNNNWLSCSNELYASGSLHYAQGLFETLYVENNLAYNLDLHLQRLTNSINCLFPLDATNFNLSHLKTQIDLAVKHLTAAKQVLKILITYANKQFQPLIFARNYLYTIEQLKSGFSLVKALSIKHSSNILLQHKTTNYWENILAKAQATTNNYNDAYFLNEQGYVTETTVANIFIISKNIIYTPPIKNGLLPGTLRSQILTAKLPLEVHEHSISEANFLAADLVFITNSLIGLVPIKKINNISFDTSNKIFQQLSTHLSRN